MSALHFGIYTKTVSLARLQSLKGPKAMVEMVLDYIPLQSPGDKDHKQGKGKAQTNDDAISKPLRERRCECDSV